MRSWSRRGALLAAVLLLAGAVGLCAPPVRDSLLRAVGWALVLDEPVEPADLVIVTVETGDAGVLEAADLVHGGIARAVAVVPDLPDAADREFRRRGVPYEDLMARAIRNLRVLGVTAIEQSPRAVAGTEDLGDVLPGWCTQRQLRSVVVVSTPDHSRRLHRVLRRAMRDHPTRTRVRVTRYASFDPDRWWETWGGIRTTVIELQKLLFDLFRHPLS